MPIRAGEELAAPSIRYTGGELPLRAARTVAVGMRRGQRLRVAVAAPEEVEGPIRRGAVLGRATVLVDGRRPRSVPLRAGRAIPKASAFDRVRSFVGDNPISSRSLAFVILIGAGLLWRQLGARRASKRSSEIGGLAE